MSIVFAAMGEARITFLQRFKMLFRRGGPKAEPLAIAEPVRPPEVMHNLKYTPGVSYEYAQLGGQS